MTPPKMKSAEEWARMFADNTATLGDIIAGVRLEAFKAGMTEAAEICKAPHEPYVRAYGDGRKEECSCDVCYTFSQLHTKITKARDTKTINDV